MRSGMKIENTPSKRNLSYYSVVILATELGTQYEKRNGRETYRYDGADDCLKSHMKVCRNWLIEISYSSDDNTTVELQLLIWLINISYPKPYVWLNISYSKQSIHHFLARTERMAGEHGYRLLQLLTGLDLSAAHKQLSRGGSYECDSVDHSQTCHSWWGCQFSIHGTTSKHLGINQDSCTRNPT